MGMGLRAINFRCSMLVFGVEHLVVLDYLPASIMEVGVFFSSCFGAHMASWHTYCTFIWLILFGKLEGKYTIHYPYISIH